MMKFVAPIMLIGWIRNAVILLLLLTIIYAILTFINRIKEKDRLKKQHASDVATENVDDFVTFSYENNFFIKKCFSNI